MPQDNWRVPSAKRAVVWLALLGLIGTLGWCAYQYKVDVGALVTSLPRAIFDGGTRKSMAASPFPPLAGSAEQMDAALQTAALWRVIKREFPDWYADRLKDTVKGVVILGIDANSPASDKRLSAGDTIVEIAQEAVASADEFQTRIDKLKSEGRRSALLLVASADGELRFVALALQ